MVCEPGMATVKRHEVETSKKRRSGSSPRNTPDDKDKEQTREDTCTGSTNIGIDDTSTNSLSRGGLATVCEEPGSSTDEDHPHRDSQRAKYLASLRPLPLGPPSVHPHYYHHPALYHHHHHHHSPPYLIDPANGWTTLDPRYVHAMEGRLGFHPPIPVDARTHEGRYHFDAPLHYPLHGHASGSSPSLSDVSLIRLTPQRGPTESPSYPLYMQHYMDQLRGSPAMSAISHARGLSPSGSYGETGLPPGHPSTMPPYHTYHGPHSLIGAEFLSGPPSTAGSIDHPALEVGSIESSRFSTPRPGDRRSRKRALSISPLSGEGLDINAMIRTSPNSLVAYINSSRSSSSASGSYGHLSAGTVSPLSWHPSVTPIAHLQQLQQQFMRQRPGIGNPFIPSSIPPPPVPQPPPAIQHHPAMATLLARAHPAGSASSENSSAAFITTDGTDTEGSRTVVDRNFKDTTYIYGKENPSPQKLLEPNNNNLVTSSLDPDSRHGRRLDASPNVVSSTCHVDIKKTSPGVDRHAKEHGGDVGPGGEDGGKGLIEEDVPVVTDCEWNDCEARFDMLEQLVQHILNDHIHNERKEFVCRWRGCIREEKPFKAQYMLVVHMRRHTGEKPHQCTFEGCQKAYSRLENLKTHLRSHTGERPYVCEFQGCTKAFSNASDRAKHQNRTHSNAKPYVCKIPGCTKRYTDPSSLRKHVKTVHGPDAHVTKKQRGDKHDRTQGGAGEGNTRDQQPGSVKSESAESVDGSVVSVGRRNDRPPSAPPLDLPIDVVQDSPAAAECLTLQHDYNSCSPHNDSGVEMTIPGGSLSDLTAIENEEKIIQDDHISSNMGPGTQRGNRGNGGGNRGATRGAALTTVSSQGARPASPLVCKPSRQKLKVNAPAVNRLAQKVKNLQGLPQLPQVNTRRGAIVNASSEFKPKDRIIVKLQAQDMGRCDSSQSVVGPMDHLGTRRGSNGSSICSSYYSSRRSSEASPFPMSQFSSRRSSEASSTYMSSRRTSGASSQFSSRLGGAASSAYDPISPGSSRRSSGAMSGMNGATGLPGLTLQEQRRLQAKYDQVTGQQNTWGEDRFGPSPLPGYANSNRHSSFPCRTPLPHEVPGVGIRRASDPIYQRQREPVLPRYNSLNNVNQLPLPQNMNNLKQRSRPLEMPPLVNNQWQDMPVDSSMGQQCGPMEIINENVGNDMAPMHNDTYRRAMQHNQGYANTMLNNSGYVNGNQIMQQEINNTNMQYQTNQVQINKSQYQQQQAYQNPLPNSMEMSPRCNQVSSTVDVPNRYDQTMDCGDAMANGLAALSTDGLDNVQPLIPNIVSPTDLINGIGCESPVVPCVNLVSNMVVNDMSSMLTSLAEENRYLNMMS